MAKLTPLAKGLITVTILAVTGAAAWHLGLKGLVMGDSDATGDNVTAGDATANDRKNPVATPAASGDTVGTDKNPLKVSIVSFHGYAPALLANGKSLTTKSGSIYDKQGVNIEFVIQDDIPALPTIFESGAAHCAWRTSDFWAQEHPNLRNAGLDARAVMVVDNTQGADAVITNDPAIKRIEDLAGKKVAMLEFTPSHGMMIDAVDNSSLSARKKKSVDFTFIAPDGGTAAVGAALVSGDVDAAALWDPDLALAMKQLPNAHVVYSTRTATNLIYDVMVCDARVLDNPANKGAIQDFVTGWMAGVDAAEADPDEAVDALIKTEDFFAQLAKTEGKGFVKDLFATLVWTGLEDNARILGMAGDTNHYERVYRRFDKIYRAAGALANPNAPVINPQDSFDYQYIEKLLAADEAAKTAAAKPEFTFSETEREKVTAQAPALTKPVEVNFTSGSAELNKRSEKTIDNDMVPMIENNGSAYFIVSGNTDSTGARGANMALSQQRAQAVVSYLIKEWEFEASRFKVVGNGPDAPLCNETNPESEGLTLDECRSSNRNTRLAILAR